MADGDCRPESAPVTVRLQSHCKKLLAFTKGLQIEAREGSADLSIIQEYFLACLHTDRCEDEQMRLQSPAAKGITHV